MSGPASAPGLLIMPPFSGLVPPGHPGHHMSQPQPGPMHYGNIVGTRDFDVVKPKPDVPVGWKLKGRIIVPSELVPDRTRIRYMPRKAGKTVAVRIVVDVMVGGPLNKKLWLAFKLPPGWRKAPRPKWKDELKGGFPVRIYTYQPRSLSQEELETIQAYVALMEATK